MAEDSEKYGESDGLPGDFRPVACFSKHLPFYVDLMNFNVDDDVFGGRLKVIVELSRAMLPGLRGGDVHNLLLAGDVVINSMAKEGVFQVTDQHGKEHPFSTEVVDRIASVDMLALVASRFPIGRHEGKGEAQLDLTAPRLCAAFALGQAFSAIVYGPHAESIAFGAYHAMQAAEAFAMAKLLSGGETHLAPLIGKRQLEAQARQGAIARLTKDSDRKQAGKAQALTMWQEWQAGRVVYKSGAEFARQVVSHTAIESTKSVERWMVKWRAEAKNRD